MLLDHFVNDSAINVFSSLFDRVTVLQEVKFLIMFYNDKQSTGNVLVKIKCFACKVHFYIV